MLLVFSHVIQRKRRLKTLTMRFTSFLEVLIKKDIFFLNFTNVIQNHLQVFIRHHWFSILFMLPFLVMMCIYDILYTNMQCIWKVGALIIISYEQLCQNLLSLSQTQCIRISTIQIRFDLCFINLIYSWMLMFLLN